MTVEATVVHKKRAIRYALAGDDGQKVSYFSGPLTRPGSRGPWSDDEDNPLSPSFRPLEGRGEYAKARWWALFGRRAARPSHGEYDAKPLQPR